MIFNSNGLDSQFQHKNGVLKIFNHASPYICLAQPMYTAHCTGSQTVDHHWLGGTQGEAEHSCQVL